MSSAAVPAVGSDPVVARLLETGLPNGGEPDWLATVRDDGRRTAARMPRPGRRDEAWRYTPVGFLDETAFVTPPAGFDALQVSDIDDLLLPASGQARLVFVNGRLAPALCSGLNPGTGVEIRHLGDAPGNSQRNSLGEPSEALRGHFDRVAGERHLFSALNSALMSDGMLLRVDSASADPVAVELLHVSVGLEEPHMAHPRHLLVLEEGARVDLVERYCSPGSAPYFNNAFVEIQQAPGSELRHTRTQEESGAAQHLSDLHVRLGANARYELTNVTLGAAWSRTDVRVHLDGEGASADLAGLMVARDRQLNDVHLDVRHNAPRCASREDFKGILDGKGRVVFDGRILVARDAQQTDAALSNDNLLLARSAEVDTKPQLEIYADDVKCSHGTTVGELDHDMLFYLRSRGIPLAGARQMLCQGFANGVLERVSEPALRARLEAQLAQRLREAR